MASCQCVLRFFYSTCLKYCACQEKVRPGHTKWCTCHAKSSQQTWRIWWSKVKPLSGNQRSDLLTSLLTEHVSCTAPATENASLRILFKCPMPAYAFENATKSSRFAFFWQGGESAALPWWFLPLLKQAASRCRLHPVYMWCHFTTFHCHDDDDDDDDDGGGGGDDDDDFNFD